MRRIDFRTLGEQRFRKSVQDIISNALDSAEIMQALARRKWTEEKMADLQDRLDQFVAKAQRFQRLKSERIGTSEDFDDAHVAFRQGSFASDHGGLADVVFQGETTVRGTLRIHDGLNNQSLPFDQWQPLASDFFDALATTPDLYSRMADFGYTRDELERGQAALDRLTALAQEEKRFDAERQQTRRERDMVREMLTNEMIRFQKLAKLVLSHRPDLLEFLGWIVPSDA